jgi:UDP-N-acetylglucosamine--dolichyl-phosphate N-acetylglucosaminephosphotransferase
LVSPLFQAINIYAGINGLEAGQSLIIGVAILTANLFELWAGAGAQSPHLFSALLAAPFISTTLGLLWYNTYPASVFVGDTYCYFAGESFPPHGGTWFVVPNLGPASFAIVRVAAVRCAGMTFAVMAILGHFSKTLLLFFIPQIVNFLYSVPQLFKLYPCPRHRMPNFDPAADRLRPSTFSLKRKTTGKNVSTSRAPASTGDGDADDLVVRDNMTVINVVLRLLGPTHERSATNVLLLVQIICCAFGLLLRYFWAPQVYEAAALQPPAHTAAGDSLSG